VELRCRTSRAAQRESDDEPIRTPESGHDGENAGMILSSAAARRGWLSGSSAQGR
jgi:hypothetical protein